MPSRVGPGRGPRRQSAPPAASHCQLCSSLSYPMRLHSCFLTRSHSLFHVPVSKCWSALLARVCGARRGVAWLVARLGLNLGHYVPAAFSTRPCLVRYLFRAMKDECPSKKKRALK